MDFTNLSIDDLKKLRDSYQDDLVALKDELEIVQSSLDNPRSEVASIVQDILMTRCSETHETSGLTEEDEVIEDEYFQSITQIKSLDVSMRSVKNEDGTKVYTYTARVRFNKIQCEVQYESNLSPNEDHLIPIEETITKLKIKVVRPILHPKIEKGFEFFQERPSCFSSAMLFLRSISDLMELRTYVVRKLYEYETNLTIGISKTSDQHSIIYKCETDNTEYLHLKWSFAWDPRTALARNLFIGKITQADDQLMAEVKPLVEKICSDKFALESSVSDKLKLFGDIMTAVKDADSRYIAITATLLP